MMEVLSTKSAVNKLLYNQRSIDLVYGQQAYLIHTSVWPDILKVMDKQFGVDFKYDSRPYTLHVGETSFDMALVVTVKNMKLTQDMQYLAYYGQFSKLWELFVYGRSTLYIELDRYHILEKFIEMHNLGKSIISTVVEPGVNTNQKQIKIVTFIEEVEYFDLLHIYIDYYQKSELLKTNNIHYYIIYAFDWLQPTRVTKLNKPLENERFFFCLHIFLDCLRENPLNILDLCSMKLAFCELSLISSFSAKLAARIDDMITVLLKKAKCDGYIQDGEFDFHGYAEQQIFNLNNPILCRYFVYTFQNHFQSIKIDSSIIDRTALVQIIKLVDPQDLLLELRGNPNITFKIDANDFSGMDAKLFYSILQCGNVEVLWLNAKVEWFNSNDTFVLDAPKWSSTMISLTSPDQFFMETFIKSLNSMANTDNWILQLEKPNLQNFSIFKNLNVGILKFSEITLTPYFLEELVEWNFHRMGKIIFNEVKIVNDVLTWLLLILFKFDFADIIEEEHTWQNLFDTIILHINHQQDDVEFARPLQFNEFVFEKKYRIKTLNGKEIELNILKFTIDEFKTKLDIKGRFSNQQIDLFDLKNELDFSPEEDDGSCYEFYQ